MGFLRQTISTFIEVNQENDNLHIGIEKYIRMDQEFMYSQAAAIKEKKKGTLRLQFILHCSELYEKSEVVQEN